MKRKLPQPKYSKGEFVWVLAEATEREIIDIKWNGYTYMYSFKGTELRCGEQYLRAVPQL